MLPDQDRPAAAATVRGGLPTSQDRLICAHVNPYADPRIGHFVVDREVVQKSEGVKISGVELVTQEAQILKRVGGIALLHSILAFTRNRKFTISRTFSH